MRVLLRNATAPACSQTAAACWRASSTSMSARKVVGVGSVGTRTWIMLLLGRDDGDPLFLQAKEAQASVLEPYLSQQRLRGPGQAGGRGAAPDAGSQ